MAQLIRKISCACWSIKALARYIVDEVQDVYRLQGVKINDKHIRSDRASDVASGSVVVTWRYELHRW